MTNLFSFDTNILIYSADPTDGTKNLVANRIVAAATLRQLPVSIQCLSEFYRAVTRKKILSQADAENFVSRATLVHSLVAPDQVDVLNAISLHRLYQLQFFDALLLATASRAGCTVLFSEDMHDGQTYGSITVRDPFRMSAAELDKVLA